MRIHPRSLLLATATILCMTINASAIQNSSLASPNSTTNTPILTTNNEIICSRTRAGQADIVSCLMLLIQIPETTFDAVFHSVGLHDKYTLPSSLSNSGCRLDVTLPYGTTEISNWPAVRFAANLIIAACTVGNYPHGSSGGSARVGLHGNIRVTIKAPSAGDLGVA